MGLRFRKSIKICKGLRINLSKSGASLSIGVRGARYTIGPRGRRATIGIPGTGIYYTVNSKHQNSGAKRREPFKKLTSNANDQNGSIVSDRNGNKYIVTLDDVKKLKEHLDKVTSFHNTCSDSVDWEYIENLEPPFAKGEIGQKELEARKAYDTCKPNILEKLNKNAFEKRKDSLHKAISIAHQEDEDAYNVWLENVNSAKGVKDGNIVAYYTAIEAADSFTDLSEYGTDIEFGTDNPNYMEIEFCSKMEDLVPIDTLKVTTTGKISHSYYTKTEFYALCQDYVCSYAIRLGRELFALLPVKNVIVHASEKIDTFSDAQRTILSVCFERDVFDEIDFSKGIDASDFVQSCIHNMDYKRTSGFKKVEKLTKDSVNYVERKLKCYQ